MKGKCTSEIPSMPAITVAQLDVTVKEVKELWSMGIKSVLLFIKAQDELKDNTGKEAWNRRWLNATKHQSNKRCSS